MWLYEHISALLGKKILNILFTYSYCIEYLNHLNSEETDTDIKSYRGDRSFNRKVNFIKAFF